MESAVNQKIVSEKHGIPVITYNSVKISQNDGKQSKKYDLLINLVKKVRTRMKMMKSEGTDF